MELPDQTKAFQEEWFNLAKVIVQRVAKDPEIVAMHKEFRDSGQLSFEQRSQFIAIANRVKGEVIHETYGPEGSEGYLAFKARWRYWYDTKGVVSTYQGDRRLTNEEHIIYSSTPEAAEFFLNFEHAEDEAKQT